MAMPGMKEYWVMHRPRHPIWGTIMFGSTGASVTGTSGTTNLYTGDEKDYLFYKYGGVNYAVTEKPWLLHTICGSMEDAVIAAKRMISYVGQDNVRIARIINGKMNIEF